LLFDVKLYGFNRVVCLLFVWYLFDCDFNPLQNPQNVTTSRLFLVPEQQYLFVCNKRRQQHIARLYLGDLTKQQINTSSAQFSHKQTKS